jgi:hypothetical protein
MILISSKRHAALSPPRITDSPLRKATTAVIVVSVMARSATFEEITEIYEYIRRFMPDLSLKEDRICVDDMLYDGIFISTKIDRDDIQILTGLLYTKAATLGLLDHDGSININMVAVKIDKIKNIVLYFT